MKYSLRFKVTRLIKTPIAVLLAALLVVPIQAIMPAQASALTGSEFDPSRIIDDGIFYNGNSMSSTDIQRFLDSKVPVCDTGGTKTYYGENATYSGKVSRSTYAQSTGNPAPPYTCLRDYVMDTAPRPADQFCSGNLSGGRKTAAQLIYEVSVACSVNPKVMLVLLQKEQSLVTDDWPWPNQIQKATGFACPDTAPCDSEFAGLYNQIYYSARQFQRYSKQANLYDYRAGRTNFVRYNPNVNCGGSTVNIVNQATAGLYVYTPYQPNAAALANLYGSGDHCSAYGNRNFWRMFNDWFGTTREGCGPNEQHMPQVVTLYNPRDYSHFYTSYRCEAEFVGFKLGYNYEGAVFNTTNPAIPGSVPVWRLYNASTGDHMWVTHQSEIDFLTQRAGYSRQGIAFYTAPPQAAKTVIWRLYNPRTYQHIWTGSQAVINLTTQQLGFKVEGPAFYSQ